MTQLEQDVLRAQSLLYDLAIELRRVPVDSSTRELHLRALQLKRDVAAWKAEHPSAAARRAVFEELGELRRLAEMWHRELGVHYGSR